MDNNNKQTNKNKQKTKQTTTKNNPDRQIDTLDFNVLSASQNHLRTIQASSISEQVWTAKAEKDTDTN